jgi:hypothetical protein
MKALIILTIIFTQMSIEFTLATVTATQQHKSSVQMLARQYYIADSTDGSPQPLYAPVTVR